MGLEKDLMKVAVVVAAAFAVNYGINYFAKIDLFTMGLSMISGFIPGAGAFVTIIAVVLVAVGGAVALKENV